MSFALLATYTQNAQDKIPKQIMDLFIDLLTGFCFFLGSLSIIIGACGLIKLPDVFARIHAAGMIDTGGTAFFILGMILQSGWSLNLGHLNHL